ncbi:hypothetical protein EJB05_45092 [Eragrostis curvula]|uniref:Uncharacterized protein n=1 Tax=Eragrostis curvula TaxID=38414 RepID=A0A5J9TLD2_9POAL|nr:hypothetical protein EJB05_45092 [Eragrostis curvula]
MSRSEFTTPSSSNPSKNLAHARDFRRPIGRTTTRPAAATSGCSIRLSVQEQGQDVFIPNSSSHMSSAFASVHPFLSVLPGRSHL